MCVCVCVTEIAELKNRHCNVNFKKTSMKKQLTLASLKLNTF